MVTRELEDRVDLARGRATGPRPQFGSEGVWENLQGKLPSERRALIDLEEG